MTAKQWGGTCDWKQNQPAKCPSALNLSYHLDPVLEAYRKRKLITGLTAVLEAIQNEDTDHCILQAERALADHTVSGTKVLDSKESLHLLVNDLELRCNLNGARLWECPGS